MEELGGGRIHGQGRCGGRGLTDNAMRRRRVGKRHGEEKKSRPRGSGERADADLGEESWDGRA